MIRDAVVIGAGHAGGRFCEAMRTAGFEGSLTLVGDESHEPYERPPLSKDVLLGLAEPGAAHIIAQPLSRLSIDHVAHRSAVAIDRSARRVMLDDGRELVYDRLVLATGVRPRAVPFPGADLGGVHGLRTATDAQVLREALARGGRLVIIGGGFIGLEVAAAAVRRGCSVTVLERAPSCLSRVIPPLSVARITALHAAQGVEIRCSVEIESLEGDARVSMVKIRNEKEIAADLVLLGLGSVPNDALAREAGLAVGNGILVNAKMQTSDPMIFAIGDVAMQVSVEGENVRHESVDQAERHAATAAAAVLGLPLPPSSPPWFWTDQFDLNVQIVGAPRPEHSVLTRVGNDGRASHHFYHQNGAVKGAVLFNAGRDRRAIAKLLAAGKPVDIEKLADATCDLRSLAA